MERNYKPVLKDPDAGRPAPPAQATPKGHPRATAAHKMTGARATPWDLEPWPAIQPLFHPR